MARWGNADFKELKELQERLQKLQNTDLNKFCEDASKELAARLLALVIPRTPEGKRPKLEGSKTEKVTGASGKKQSFLTAEGARYERYWSGYMGGTLRRGWIAKTQAEAENSTGRPSAKQASDYAKSLPIEKSGDYYIVRVINPVEYASYVEFGHRQTPGRFVPQIGKRLKSGWANGKYFLTLSEDDLERVAPAVLQKKLDDMLREVFNG